MRRLSIPRLLALGLGGSLLFAATPVGASTKAPTTGSLLTATKTAIGKQQGVHLVVATAKGATMNKVVADLGKNIGVEQVTSGSATATVKVTPNAAYLGGNSAGLTTLIGLTAAEAKKVGKLWIAVKSTSSNFSGLKQQTTIGAIDDVLPAAKGTKLSKDTSTSTPLYLLKWDVAATSSAPKLSNTLKLKASGATLPTEEDVDDSTGSSSTKFTKWGEKVAVTAPPVALQIDISKIG